MNEPGRVTVLVLAGLIAGDGHKLLGLLAGLRQLELRVGIRRVSRRDGRKLLDGVRQVLRERHAPVPERQRLPAVKVEGVNVQSTL